ncbi:PAS domain-containing protein [Deinococcus sp. Arct2-2]|uniref:PAS domain-containing protein n=1 Tax=Deinococcus sp. Arct2-2 TaxID=2568653 RepID=UPI0010A4685B|nr:PAS domain-containing protein [Deinococcus sp. Arct2-2]THF66715.1 PAS domain-containing protein [Deinococcus sp. Arct2-2]
MPDTELLTPPPHPVLTSLCRLISDRLGADLALITDAQHTVLASHRWPLSLPVPPLASLMTADMLVLTDTTHDARFKLLADAMGGFQTGFYAASSLRNSGGEVLGFLYLLRQLPRTFERQHYQAFLDAICLASDYLVQQQAFRRAVQIGARLLPFESGVKTLTDAVIAYDQRGQVTYANRAAEQLFGASVSNLEGQPLTALIPGGPDSLPVADTQRWQLGHANGLTQDGLLLHLEIASRQLQLGSSHSTLLIRNVSEQRGAVAALAQSQLHTQALLQAIPDALFVLSREGVVLSYNPDSLRLQRDPVGRSMYQVWPVDTAGLVMVYLNLTLQSNRRSRAFMLQPPLGTDDGLKLEGRLTPMGSERGLLVVRNLTAEGQPNKTDLNDAPAADSGPIPSHPLPSHPANSSPVNSSIATEHHEPDA